jgi:putative protease
LSVQAGACNAPAIKFFEQRFNIKGVVLPRVLTIEEIKEIREATTLKLEVFVFGILCINFEGSCRLSSYMTGLPNSTKGSCSPPDHVLMEEDEGRLRVRLAGYLLNEFAPGETATYPTPCKGRYLNQFLNEVAYPFQIPATLNTLSLLPKFIRAGVDAVKVEGRQRSHVYVREVTRVFRQAIDSYYHDPAAFQVKESWEKKLLKHAEGKKFVQACYLEK